MREWNLPPEFEVSPFTVCTELSLKVTVNQIICRDLWALHLLLLRDPPPPEPWVFLQEQEDKRKPDLTFDNPPPPAPSQGTDSRIPKGVPVEYKDKEISGGGDSSDSDDDIAQQPTHRESADPELAALLREASESSSSSSEEQRDSLPDHDGSSKTTKMRRQKNRYELPISTLAVVVLACWTMRLPIIYMDIIRYAILVSMYPIVEMNDIVQIGL
jgi:RNA polymerase I-specific transcription initiation factor RRN7